MEVFRQQLFKLLHDLLLSQRVCELTASHHSAVGIWGIVFSLVLLCSVPLFKTTPKTKQQWTYKRGSPVLVTGSDSWKYEGEFQK